MAATGQILGLRLRRTGPTMLSLSKGWARSEDDTVDILSTSSLEITSGSTGIGGLDAGSASPNTPYAVWVLQKPAGGVGALMSLAFDASEVTLPKQWSTASLRRVGAVSTNSNGNFVSFRQLGAQNERRYVFDSIIDSRQILTGGTSATWVAVERTSHVPRSAELVQVYLVPSSAEVEARSIGAQKQLFATSPILFEFTTEHDDDLLEYRKKSGGGSVDAYLLGFTEYL